MIHFFGDYTRAEVGKNRIVDFFEGFEQYSGYKGNQKLGKAIKEARNFLIGEQILDECVVCKIPELKAKYYQSSRSNAIKF